MRKKRAFNEVPYASRLDWLSSKEIARRLNVRTRQVDGWALHGYVRSCKQGRRRLICEEDCWSWFRDSDRSNRRFTSKNRASGTTRTAPPAPEPAPEPPPIRCEVVPIQVNGTELAGIRLDGQEVIAAQLLERLLGLQPKSLSARVGRDEWFVKGEDYVVLRGREMGTLREKVVDVLPTTSLQSSPQLMILTEDGVTKVLTTIRSRVTDALATTMLKSNFMRRAARAVMQGDEEGFASNAADDATDALAKLRLFVTTELSEMQGHLAAALEENRDLRQQLDENTYKLDMVDKRLVHMPDDVARSLAPMIAEMARKTHSTGPGFVRDPLLPRPIRPNEDAFYYPRLSSTDVAHKVRRGLPRSQSGSINTQAINACGQKYAGQYWSNRGEEFFGQDWPGYIEKGQSKYGTLRYWYSEAFIPKALKWFRSGQLDLPFTGQQP